MDCEFCNLSDEDKKYEIYKNNCWSAYLADNQNYIGRCIVICNQHIENLSDLSDEQWFELKQIINVLEAAVKKYSAQMYLIGLVL